MTDLLNKLVIFAYCLLAVIWYTPDAVFVLFCLMAVAVSASCSFFHNPRYSLASTLLYVIGGCFFPPCMYFFPLVLYESFETAAWKSVVPTIVIALSTSVGSQFLSFKTIFHLVVGILLTFLFHLWAMQFSQLEERYRSLQDDSTEQNLRLTDTNRKLLEKQDYEIYTATLQERNRIAREIHDNVGHMLSRAILMTGAMKAISQDATLKDPLDNLDLTLNAAMTSIRQSVHDLHDESVNLKEAVQSLLDDFTFCQTRFEFDMGYALPRELKYSFIAIVKEALVNVSRHSNATLVTISMREHPAFWQLDIQDNETGGEKTIFPPEISESISTGIGLSNIRERILSLHGQVEFRKTLGFRIFATIPKGKGEKTND